jgi:hypothetical protein
VVGVYGARLKRGLQQGKQAKGKPSAGAEVGEKRTGEKKKKKKMSWWWRMYTVGWEWPGRSRRVNQHGPGVSGCRALRGATARYCTTAPAATAAR